MRRLFIATVAVGVALYILWRRLSRVRQGLAVRRVERLLAVSNGNLDAPALEALRVSGEAARGAANYRHHAMITAILTHHTREARLPPSLAQNAMRAARLHRRLAILDIAARAAAGQPVRGAPTLLDQMAAFDLGEPAGQFPHVQVATELVSDAQKKARQHAMPAAKLASYTEESQQHVNDMQNVHDTVVNNKMRTIVDDLKKECLVHSGAPRMNFEEIREALTKKSPALRPYFDNMAHTPRVFNTSEPEMLELVWNRSFLPKNAANAENIRQMVQDTLVELASAPPCPTGRITRLAGALTLLDEDPRFSSIATLEQTKNEIFTAVQGAIADFAKECAAGKNGPELVAVGRSFAAASPAELATLAVTPEAEQQFRARMAPQIAELVDTRLREAGGVPPSVRASVLAQAQGALL